MKTDLTPKAVCDLLFSGGGSVSRPGCYDIQPRSLYKAISHFADTGENMLKEHDDIMCSSWMVDSNMMLDQQSSKVIRKCLDGKGFWKIEEIVPNKDIPALIAATERAEANAHLYATYDYRRREASAYTANRKTRARIFRRDGYTCLLCGSTDRLSIDHIVSVKRGGHDGDDNLQTLCLSCNSSKSFK